MYNSEEEKCVLNAEMNQKLNNVILPHQQFLVPIEQQCCSFYLIYYLYNSCGRDKICCYFTFNKDCGIQKRIW